MGPISPKVFPITSTKTEKHSQLQVQISEFIKSSKSYPLSLIKLKAAAKKNSGGGEVPHPLVELCTEDNKQINVICKDSQRFSQSYYRIQ